MSGATLSRLENYVIEAVVRHDVERVISDGLGRETARLTEVGGS